ncbi:cysteate synthase [Methanosphaerula palustris]|uniref:Cysteate synthase n=1 Tax=Methanosphaerula palustris (strain ATCC BAA-1556 / DSM 19958 / E1-9c) TaxID=521011 RepID=CYAS_METPE|nr:cysteate synthase [Methanosphaerula palustris]B8GFW4.1 RecName: Full=Cysteate synthase; Short=CS; Short=Cya synthase [Methanosphaerula palustris E1-9c]ACL17997.1 Pyridoxal-5'-phosphate-dependent protein beta subunit [Methanosphaerula palustris E1-9c]
MSGDYQLRCPTCGLRITDRYSSFCPAGHPGLLVTDYPERTLSLSGQPGIFRYESWLPVRGRLPFTGGTVTYQSDGLAEELGLAHLFIGFNGYWPERGADLVTCSFKELEAVPSMLRATERTAGILVVASAGNTARAFCQVSALTGIPVVIVVPQSALPRLWTTEPAPAALVIGVDGDYADAIAYSTALAAVDPRLIVEGGARNVARRDGMGTVMLDGAVTIGRIPDHYVQAVGSGTGGVAAYEAASRLIRDGRFGGRLPILHLAQNLPFVPMVAAWEEHTRDLQVGPGTPYTEEAEQWVSAPVLTNRTPPYGVPGGTYDALEATGGEMYAISNGLARAAGTLFTDCEGIDLDPAAAVATASLIQAIEMGTIEPGSRVLLNITGGGYDRVVEDHTLVPTPAGYRVPAGNPDDEIRRDVITWVNDHA